VPGAGPALGAGLLAVVLGAAPAFAADAPTATETAATAPAARGLARWLDPARAPFIPVPEIDVDPHSGLTLGLIPTWLTTNSAGEIVRILAPDLIHSQYFGWGSRLRLFGYPSADTQWSVVGGGKERVEREFDARYLSGQLRRQRWSWSLESLYDRSGTPRFFGLGNDSPRSRETSYLDNQALLDATLGVNITPALQLSYRERARYVDVLPAVLRSLPSIGARFPTLKGLGREHELQQTLIATCDTRDSLTIPQRGGRYLLYGGFVSHALGSSTAYSYFGAEARRYWALAPELTLAWHLGARYMPSAAGAPFWALSSLGGDRSVLDEREPLRAVGSDRYIDRNLFAFGAELRARVLSFDAFGTRVGLELTPFLDAGKVFSGMGVNPLNHLHTAPGLGLRGVASPFVVGYLDLGFGSGRPAVFSGIDYPF
jgi:hypothetical protein